MFCMKIYLNRFRPYAIIFSAVREDNNCYDVIITFEIKINERNNNGGCVLDVCVCIISVCA